MSEKPKRVSGRKSEAIERRSRMAAKKREELRLRNMKIIAIYDELSLARQPGTSNGELHTLVAEKYNFNVGLSGLKINKNIVKEVIATRKS